MNSYTQNIQRDFVSTQKRNAFRQTVQLHIPTTKTSAITTQYTMTGAVESFSIIIMNISHDRKLLSLLSRKALLGNSKKKKENTKRKKKQTKKTK